MLLKQRFFRFRKVVREPKKSGARGRAEGNFEFVVVDLMWDLVTNTMGMNPQQYFAKNDQIAVKQKMRGLC